MLSPDGATVTILNPRAVQDIRGKIAHERPIGRRGRTRRREPGGSVVGALEGVRVGR